MSNQASSSSTPATGELPPTKAQTAAAKFKNRRAKVVLLGAAGVGKTSLLNRHNDEFDANVSETVGAGYALATVALPNGNKIELQVWDTAGQERYRSMAPLYYRNADGALVVYDITNRQSFEGVKRWVNELTQFVGSDISICVVGNKVDLEEGRMVMTKEGKDYAVVGGNLFVETSAVTGTGVSDAFQCLAARIMGMPYDSKSQDTRGFDVSFKFQPDQDTAEKQKKCGGC